MGNEFFGKRAVNPAQSIAAETPTPSGLSARPAA